MASRQLLQKAARRMKREAEAIRESCEGSDGDWACGTCEKDAKGRCQAKRDYDDMARTAAALKAAA